MKQQSGFTLIELAIALMVIGLLIGGVLKGQELIENAKITAVTRELAAFDAAAMIFYNTYDKYPGDIRSPGTRLPNCTITPCNEEGNGDGMIANGGSAVEYYNYFVHLNKAGLISSTPGHPTAFSVYSLPGDLEEKNIFPVFFEEGNRITTQSHAGGTIFGSYTYPAGIITYHPNPYTNTPVRRMAALDRKIDDGKPMTGSVFQQSSALSCVTTSTNTYNEATAGTTCGRGMIMRW